MSNIKVTIFQKNINTSISKEQKTKLISQNSDFLLLPRFFPFLDGWSSNQEEKERKYLDKILEISEFYKGVIIGGSLFRKEGKFFIESYPLIQNVRLIDYYNLRSGDTIGNIKIHPSDSDSFFILGGVRFAFLPATDFQKEEYLKQAASEKIELIFNLSSPLQSPSELELYNQDLQYYSDLSQKYHFNIVRCSGIGNFGEFSFSGRSFCTSETGIRWKVAAKENLTEIIKTVNISIKENLPS